MSAWRHKNHWYDLCGCGQPKRDISTRCLTCHNARFSKDPVARFWSFVDKTDTCWFWIGTRSDTGYGSLPPYVNAHRFAYETFVGPIPKGLEIDHLCRVRACVNPAHLEAVTHQENVRRGAASGFRCGHPYTIENSYFRPDNPTTRQCRVCIRRRSDELQARRQAARVAA